jgi:2,5-diketo-D-gluconate reductase A
MDQTNAPLEQALVRLNDGRMMPQLGFGTYKLAAGDTADLVTGAISAGYRAIDTASMYQNEDGVGQGVRDSDIPREQIFVTTKLANDDQGYDRTLAAFDASAKRLDIDHVDLYLIHWPHPQAKLYVETWKALVRLQEEGRAKSIGVSNFTAHNLERIIDATGVKPALNQIELHPRFQQVELKAWLEENDIAVESWSPLGQAQILKDPVIARIAEKHGREPAQIVIRWHLDQGIITIPKAADRVHMVGNLAVGGFTLDDDDMKAIGALDDPDGRLGPDPLTN